MQSTTDELKRISDEAQAASLTCEDALFSLEEREARRAERMPRR